MQKINIKKAVGKLIGLVTGKPWLLVNNKTGAIVFVTVVVMLTVQIMITLALAGEWARAFDQLIILILIGVGVNLVYTIEFDNGFIKKQQKLVNELFTLAKKQEELLKEKQSIINKISGHLAQAKGELNKKNGNTKKEQSTDESAAANTGA